MAALALAAIGCVALLVVLAKLFPGRPIALYRVNVKEALVEMPFFLIGALFWALDRTHPGLWRADLMLLAFAANWVVATWLGRWDLLVEWPTIPYMAIGFGRLAAPWLGRFGRWGNPSYGLYLYAFPIQQLVVARMPGNPHPILTCVAITLPVAYASWHLVERPALRRAGMAERYLGRLIAHAA